MTIASRSDTDEVLNQSPPYENIDLFSSDTPLIEAVEANGAGAEAAGFSAFGRQWGTADMFALARRANENPPKLYIFDPKGFRRDVVEFHPAYHDLMRASVAAGLHASTWTRSGTRAAPPAEVARAARYYMTAQIESGHLCPITMTRAALAALAAEPALVAQVAPKVATTSYDAAFRPWWDKAGMTLGMGMTEKQGGTDVRANSTTATPAGDHYTVTGHKWFLSAPMCDAFLVLAQAPGGLTCFFMPRFRPDGSVNGLNFQRLKDKLGNRSNASSEVEFAEAFALRVGEEGAGVRTIIQMVQLTRLDCALASSGFMRMALAQAVHHSRHRSVFQKHLYDQPMMHAVLADLALEVEGAVALVMRLARAFDRAASDPREAAYARAGHAGGKILDLQDRARVHLRSDGMPRRQWIRRGERVAAALSRGSGQRHLGGLGQCHVPRRAPRAAARRRGSRSPSRAGPRRGAAFRRRNRSVEPKSDPESEATARVTVGRLAALAAAAALNATAPSKVADAFRRDAARRAARRPLRHQRHRRAGGRTDIAAGAAPSLDLHAGRMGFDSRSRAPCRM